MNIIQNDDNYTRIYDENYSAVYRYFYFKTGNRQLAEDLTADTFVKAYRSYSKYDQSKSAVLTWLFILGKSVYIDNLRKNKQLIYNLEELTEEIQSNETPENTAIIGDTYRQLYYALSQLNDRERNMIALKYSSGLKNKEIAAVTGRSERHTAVTLGRTLMKLKKILNKMGVDEYE